MNRLSTNESRSLENMKTVTYKCTPNEDLLNKCTPNEDLLNESINKEITPGYKCNIFIKRLKNDVGEKRIREWEGQNKCDIEIRCGEFKTKAHSEVLSNVSDYFKANINYNKDVHKFSINREFVSPDAFNDVICYAYTGIFEISSNKVQDSIATASYLQVKIILDECEKFLIKNIDDSSAISLLPFAIRFDLRSLIETINISISENFDSLVDRNAFTRLSHDDFKFLLMNRNLSVFQKRIPVDNPEIHIIEAVGKTLTANQVDDVSIIKDILSAIRFSDLPKKWREYSSWYSPKAKHSIISEHEFDLDENEVITNISIRSGALIASLSFDTNYGRTYGPYGSDAGFPSSSSPPQKRGYFHSFHGMVYKGRYEYFIANIEFKWVVFETHNTDNKEPSIHSDESWYFKPRSLDRNSPLEAMVCYESGDEGYDNIDTMSLID
ncbi:KLHL1_4_5 [Mytilus coruscus]|uniref:KLHL1_4_5 n=1 Tax=Mytilus coruscus TaxID=42192 RepID=A0A6J8B8I6_MYTCO|nr:KLHL1_4_5 [Mytilus coruscus]